MADFVVSGQLDPRQLLEGLKQFEQQAGQAGQRAGENLFRGIDSSVSKEIPSSLSKALKAAESNANSSGGAIGKSLAVGVSTQVGSTIPSALQKALSSAAPTATNSGKQLGTNLTAGVTGAVSTAIPSALSKALSTGVSGASSSGKQLGSNLASSANSAVQGQLPAGITKAVEAGVNGSGAAGKQLGSALAGATGNSLLSLLPPSFTKAVQAAGGQAQSSATQIGSGIGANIGTGVGSTLPAQFKRVFSQTEGQAAQSGRVSGTAIGQGIGQGINAQTALFASVVSQAQKAAREVGIVFNTTKLQFEFPNGGLIPEAELTKLRNLSPLLNTAAHDLSNLQAGYGQATIGGLELGNSFSKVAGQGQLMQSMVMGISFAITNTLVGAFGSAKQALQGMTASFMQLDGELRKAAAAAGEAGAYEKLQQVVDRVGIEAAGTQQDVAELATSLVRMGFSVKDVEKALPGVVRGAEATGTGFAEMGDITGAVLRGFQLDTKETARVVDLLVAAANQSAADVTDIGYSMQYAAPIAAALGVKVEDLAASLGLMANAGIKGTVAGTGLRMGLTRLSKAAGGASAEALNLGRGQEKLVESMKVLGAEVLDANGNLLPMDETLLRLKASMDKFSTIQKVELTSALFGDEAGSKFLSVLNQSEADIQKMFDTMRNSAGQTDTARDAMLGFGLAVAQLQGSIGVLGNSIGQVIAAALTPFVNVANLALSVITLIPKPILSVVAALSLLTAGYVAAKIAAYAFSKALQTEMIQSVIKELRLLAAFLKLNFAKDLTAARTAWTAFTTALSKQGWAQAAIAAIQQITAGLKAMNAQQAVQGFKNLGSAIVGAGTAGTKSLAGLAQNGLQLVAKGAINGGSALATFGARMAGVANASAAAEVGLTGASKVLQQGMTAGANAASKSASGLGTVLMKLGTEPVKTMSLGFQAVGTAIQTAAGQMVRFATSASVVGPIGIAVAAAITAVTVAVTSYNNIMGKSRQVTEALQPSVDALAKSLKDAGVEFTDFGKQGGPVAEALTSLKRGFLDAEDNARKFVVGLKDIPVVGGLVVNAGNAMINALKWGTPIGAAISSIKGLVQTLGELKKAYDDSVKEAQTNQAILEAADQFNQLEEQVNKAVGATDRYFQTLQNTQSLNPAQLEAFTTVYEKQVGVLSKAVIATSEFGSALQLLAQQEAATGNSELASYYQSLAVNTQSLNDKATERLQKLQEEAVRAGVVKDKNLQLEYGLATLTLQYQKLAKEVSTAQLESAAGDQLIQVGQAVIKLEESRFAIVKARAQYEISESEKYWSARMKQAKDAGASEAQIRNLEKAALQEKEAIEARLAAQEKANLNAKYQGLLAQQALENAIFQINIKRRQLEADASVKQATLAFMTAEREHAAAMQGSSEKRKAEASEALAKAQEALTTAQQEKSLLDQTIPLETMVKNLTNEQAINMAQAEAAAKGITLEVGNAVQPTQAMKDAAAAAGYSFVQGANGAFTLQQNAANAATATGQTATQASNAATNLNNAGNAAQAAASGLNDAANKAGATATNANNMGQGLKNAQSGAQGVATQLGAAGQKAGEAATQTGNIGKNANANSLNPLNQALGQAAEDATVVATAQMAANLSKASGSAGGLRNAMQAAANAAKDFYNWLQQASGLPGSRWSGGPVEGGQSYRINELGQEAFLSNSGRLSLINKPANTLWTAPTGGVVIPAGITEGLKDKGVFTPGGQASGAVSGKRLIRSGSSGEREQAVVLARQAVAIGKLQQSVDRLVEKDWNVQVRVRNDAGGSTHLNALNRIR